MRNKLNAGAFLLAAALSSQLAAEGDPERGRILADPCLGCHGIEGNMTTYPPYHVPRLGGQNANYIVKALQGYAGDDREHDGMHAQAADLSDQDLQDIAAYFANEATVVADTEVTPPEAGIYCVSCHGANGVSITTEFPHLAGQYADYMHETIRQYLDGERSDISMNAFLNLLTEEQLDELVQFYAEQPGLVTAKR
ncbi:c-type cytochrome [Candidatus Foliamicus sp.]